MCSHRVKGTLLKDQVPFPIGKKEEEMKYETKMIGMNLDTGAVLKCNVVGNEYSENNFSLDCCTTLTPAAVPCMNKETPCSKKKENTMEYDFDCEEYCSSTEQSQRRYLNHRLDQAAFQKRSEFDKTFCMNDDDPPASPKEMMERIAAGKFTIDQIKDDEGNLLNKFPHYTTASRALNWRDPAKPADQKGYDAALNKMYAERTKTLDTISVMPPADGLAALRAFESSTIN